LRKWRSASSTPRRVSSVAGYREIPKLVAAPPRNLFSDAPLRSSPEILAALADTESASDRERPHTRRNKHVAGYSFVLNDRRPSGWDPAERLNDQDVDGVMIVRFLAGVVYRAVQTIFAHPGMGFGGGIAHIRPDQR